MKALSRSPFTLIELLVVVAIIGILASMLLPALNQARKQAKLTLCISQMKQHVVAHSSYSGDYDGFYPSFGGDVNPLDNYGRTISAELRMQRFPVGTASGGTTYITDYLNVQDQTPQTENKILYCAGNSFSSKGYYIMDNPAYLTFTNNLTFRPTMGYFFYTGRKMAGSTHSNADTRQRRADGGEILITDPNGHSDRDETGSNYRRVRSWLFNPHESIDCQPTKEGRANQGLADGSVNSYRFSDAKQTVAWGTHNYAFAKTVGPNNSLNNGKYFVDREY